MIGHADLLVEQLHGHIENPAGRYQGKAMVDRSRRLDTATHQHDSATLANVTV
jgi:hypothetical protein